MKSSLPCTVLLALAVWAAGCVSPETRINQSPETFARLSPEHQALVREGKVGLGFSADAVRLAVGEPDRRWTRTDAAGNSEVWSYTSWENDLGRPLYRGWYHLQADYAPLYYMNASARREREYFKVVFGRDGRVVAVEQDSR